MLQNLVESFFLFLIFFYFFTSVLHWPSPFRSSVWEIFLFLLQKVNSKRLMNPFHINWNSWFCIWVGSSMTSKIKCFNNEFLFYWLLFSKLQEFDYFYLQDLFCLLELLISTVYVIKTAEPWTIFVILKENHAWTSPAEAILHVLLWRPTFFNFGQSLQTSISSTRGTLILLILLPVQF